MFQLKRGRCTVGSICTEQAGSGYFGADSVKKKPVRTVYLSQRNSSTDFPVLTCSVGLFADGEVRAAVGACPQRARLVPDTQGIPKDFLNKNQEEQEKSAMDFAQYAKEL